MPAKDIFHTTVRQALIKDGWVITHDPLVISMGGPDVYVDLGAEQPLAAEKGGRKIAVEIKSFVGASEVVDFERAMGQYVFYRALLAQAEPERKIYLAVPQRAFTGIFSLRMGQIVIADQKVALLVFDPQQEVIIRWLD